MVADWRTCAVRLAQQKALGKPKCNQSATMSEQTTLRNHKKMKRLITNDELKNIAEKTYVCWQLNSRVTWSLSDIEKMASALCELCKVRGVDVVNRVIEFDEPDDKSDAQREG